jgi:hypothetical protein
LPVRNRVQVLLGNVLINVRHHAATNRRRHSVNDM